jgi:hypothetical protein
MVERQIMNCWEFRKCPVERRDKCPAYPNHGTHCTRVQGTLDDGEEQHSVVRKLELCFKCDFYASEYFDKNYRGLIFQDNVQSKNK